MIRRLFILVALLMPLPAAAVIAGSGPVSAAQIHLYAAQQASQAAQADFVYCVNERSTCTIKGTADIAFGANGNFYYAYGVTGNIPCTGAVFGDPDVGVEKACYVHQDTGPTRYAFCVSEGRLCTFGGHANVAFGADGKFNYEYGITGPISCSDPVFGDPDQSVVKGCYIEAGHRPSRVHILRPGGADVHHHRHRRYRLRCGWEVPLQERGDREHPLHRRRVR